MNNRYFSFDLFKFIALSCIMVYHTLDYWSLESSRNFIQTSSYFIEQVWNLGGIFCYFPCIGLTFVSGISFFLMIQKKINDNRITLKLDNIRFILKRCGFLFFMAYFMLICSPYRSDLYHWDILQFIGLASFISFLSLKYLPASKFWLLSICSFLIYLITRDLALGFNDQDDTFYSLLFRATIGSNSGKSYYSFFPWSMYFFLGVCFGFNYINNKEKLIKNIKILLILLSPAYLLTFKYWTLDYSNVWGSHFYLPTFLECFGILFTMLAFSLICIKTESVKLNSKIKNVINIFSQNIIYVFVTHSIIVFLFVDYVRSKTDSDIIFCILVVSQYLFSFSVAYLVYLIKNNRKKNVDI